MVSTTWSRLAFSHSRHTCRRPVTAAHRPSFWHRQPYYFSTQSDNTTEPFFLWLGQELDNARSFSTGRLLLPTSPPNHLVQVDSAETALRLVNEHYESEAQFVGGMGESDSGVWFATVANDDKEESGQTAAKQAKDTLDFAELVAESIELIKLERHGVPFGLYTNGCPVDCSVPVTELGLDYLNVSLWAGSVKDYRDAITTATACRDDEEILARNFHQACGFIADAAEQGLNVEVGLLRKYATGAARELAHSLGARQVHVYDRTL